MIIKVHSTRWKDVAVRRRILAYARDRAVTRGRRVIVKIKEPHYLRTIVTITPW